MFFRTKKLSKRKIGKNADVSEMPLCQRRLIPKPIEHYAKQYKHLDQTIVSTGSNIQKTAI